MTLLFDYQLKCRHAFLIPECTNRLTFNECMQSQKPSQVLFPNDVSCLLMSMCLVRAWLPLLTQMFPISMKSHQCHQTTIATLHTKQSGVHFLLWCRQFRNGWYSFLVSLEKNLPGLFNALLLSFIKQELHSHITKEFDNRWVSTLTSNDWPQWQYILSK